MSADGGGPPPAVETPTAAIDARLAALRADDRRRAAVVVAGVLVGLGLGWLHWLALALGGALVALPARTVPRGLALGAGLGLLELLLVAVLLASRGTLGPVLETGTVGVVAVAVGLGAPLLGSLVRGLV